MWKHFCSLVLCWRELVEILVDSDIEDLVWGIDDSVSIAVRDTVVTLDR